MSAATTTRDAGTSATAQGGPYRRRIIAAAAEVTAESGWSAVTMAGLAARVGVSRQTVYNEVGSKPELAEAMVLDELARFLVTVEIAFDAHPDDPVAALRDAVVGVLRLAEDRPLPRAIVAAGYGADTELLPLLTTRSRAVLASATVVVGERLSRYPLSVAPARRDAVVDVVVRAVLSHVMQPGGTPESVADDLAWAAGRLLGVAA